MPPPPIQVFLTTIVMNPQIRQRQELLLRVLQVKKVPFTSYDLASDEDAKKLWRRKAPRDKQQLPGLLIGGEYPGDFQAFEEAVEFEELDQFLRLKEDWKPFDDEKPLLRAVPVGVPGAYSPAQMNPEHISPAPSPVRSKPPPARREGEVDAGEHLEDASLRGINVTEDDLLKLVEELGLDGADADELVKGLKGEETPVKEEESKEVVQPEAALKEEPVKEKPEAQAEAEQADESKVEEAKAEAEEAKAKEMEADVNAPVESQAGGSTKTEPVLAVSDVSADKVGPDATNAVEEPAHA